MDTHAGMAKYEGKQVVLEIYDTAGQQDFAAMRPVVYRTPTPAQCFVVCFSLVDLESFNNAKTVWLNELNQLGPVNCPKLLLGLKSDMRDEFMEKEKTKS